MNASDRLAFHARSRGAAPGAGRAMILRMLVAGAIVVVLVFLCVQRLTSSLLIGLVASALLLTDGIAHFEMAGWRAYYDREWG